MEHVHPHGRAVITFDDGPDTDATPGVLDALERVHTHATFFMVGSQVERRPALAREIHLRGHDVALHCQEHRRLDKLPTKDVREDIVRGFAAIQEATGVSCAWYRPPFGRMTPAAVDTCRELGMALVYWSAWGIDWEIMSADRITGLVARELSDGAILLLHDSARFGRRPSAVPTAEAIPLIAALAAERGLVLTSLAEAIQAGPLAGATLA